MEITGKIVYINPTRRPKEDSEFIVRDFAIDTSFEVNGNIYENYVSFQCNNKKTSLLDKFSIGDEVKVDFGLTGRLNKKTDEQGTEKNPDANVVFTNLVVADITLIKSANQNGHLQPQQSEQNTPTPTPNQEGEQGADLPF